MADDVPDTAHIVRRSRWDALFDWNFMALPTVSYQPETDWAFGLAGVYYYKFGGTTKTSDVSFDAAYTLRKQWNVNVSSFMYFGGDKRWLLYAKFGFKRYPDYFYGIGNATHGRLTERLSYTADNVSVVLQPQCYVGEHWLIGASVDFRWERPSVSADLDSVAQVCSVVGLDHQFFMLGLGAVVSYDSRDEQFYPHRGLFFKAVGSYYEPYLGSSYRMGKVSADLRYFVPIYKDFIFAWQFATDWTFGTNKPFQYLATIGGQDFGRGLRYGAWRDDVMLNLQAEFRIPIWRFIKASVFANVGDVYNLSDWRWAVPKVGYGAGLRVAITKAKVNVRFDVARNNINNSWRQDGWSFYLTVKEAF
ncbi:MAG: BamA/TamA family outer membrane protein [Paludibacteraceae bacterium]